MTGGAGVDAETLTVCVLFFMVDSIPGKEVHVGPVPSALRLLCVDVCPKLGLFPALITSPALRGLEPGPRRGVPPTPAK